ncbi:crossover junction endodeoxyribonuclease RuvC [Actinomyces oris]|uniref:Crossover junction endodeoxyribonuclease RuvC n=1 Tax=Actinomyces oris TaxID=544580 RepID=A0A1Q8VTA2_9ACTO|nr:crossover junction endodeoxyribonuclease RuvC [Actinomyces oris]
MDVAGSRPRSARAVVAQQRVLGIDPGLTRCGLGCVDVDPRRQVRLVEVGVVRTPPSQSPELRLLTITEAIEDWIARLGPSVVSIERVFAQDNLRSVIGVAQVMGTAMATAARAGLEVAQHTPSEAKAAVTGSGTADKTQVQAMVTRILGLDAPPRPADAADALAQAICHGWRGGGTGTDDATEMVSAGGAVRVSARTPAQRQWAAAQAAARRTGAVDPRRVRR